MTNDGTAPGRPAHGAPLALVAATVSHVAVHDTVRAGPR